MSFPIVIQGTTIEFPSSAESPNWAPALIAFALAVQNALSSVAGPFDVPPQVYTMVANSNTDVSLPDLAFPTSQVRGAFIRYTVFRTTDSTTVYEIGELQIVYNPVGPVGNKWEISRSFTGNGNLTFSVLDTGQVTFTSSTIAGNGHQGFISFAASALLQS